MPETRHVMTQQEFIRKVMMLVNQLHTDGNSVPAYVVVVGNQTGGTEIGSNVVNVYSKCGMLQSASYDIMCDLYNASKAAEKL